MIQPFGAMIIGTVAGVVSTLGFQFLTPFLNHYFIHDTCYIFIFLWLQISYNKFSLNLFILGGVNNLHGMPGIISGLGSAVVAALAKYNDYHGAERFF